MDELKQALTDALDELQWLYDMYEYGTDKYEKGMAFIKRLEAILEDKMRVYYLGESLLTQKNGYMDTISRDSQGY